MIRIPTETSADELLSLLYGDAIPTNAPREDLHAAPYQAVQILADHEAMLLRLSALVEPLGQSPDPTDEEIAEAWQDFRRRHGALGGVANGTHSGEGAAVDIEEPKAVGSRFGGQWGSVVGTAMGKLIGKDEPEGGAVDHPEAPADEARIDLGFDAFGLRESTADPALDSLRFDPPAKPEDDEPEGGDA